MSTAHTGWSLHTLRERYPTWAFLYDPFALRWFALRGRSITVVADTAEELATRIKHFRARPACRSQRPRGQGPDYAR
ncbi:hypothetical protein [Microtetraspora malaysiensis]|uniref:hypothetical protein n=1 Tax=Microtetraspora malaysiensis TaxID=161358 RepID=UPI000B1DCDE7|nr:hypothetical protein [Microtetraspora malaysiensis]